MRVLGSERLSSDLPYSTQWIEDEDVAAVISVLKSGWLTQGPAIEAFEQALAALEQNHDFLLSGEVFTPEVIRTWIDFKRRNEVDALRLRPHPYEFCLYYDI